MTPDPGPPPPVPRPQSRLCRGHTLTSPIQPLHRALRRAVGRGADARWAAAVPKASAPVVGVERACVRADCLPRRRPRRAAQRRRTLFLLPQTQLPEPGSLRLARPSRPVMGSCRSLSVRPQVLGRVGTAAEFRGLPCHLGRPGWAPRPASPCSARSPRRWAGPGLGRQAEQPRACALWNGAPCSPHPELPSPAPGHLCALRLQPLRARSPAAPTGPPRGTRRQPPERACAPHRTALAMDPIFMVRGVSLLCNSRRNPQRL